MYYIKPIQLWSEGIMQEPVNNDDILYPGAYHLLTCLVRSRFGTLDEL